MASQDTATDDLKRNTGAAPAGASPKSLLGRFAAQFSDSPVSFDVTLPSGAVQRFGPGTPSFHVTLKNAQAMRAVTSVDEGRIGDAYLAGDLDIAAIYGDASAASGP